MQNKLKCLQPPICAVSSELNPALNIQNKQTQNKHLSFSFFSLQTEDINRTSHYQPHDGKSVVFNVHVSEKTADVTSVSDGTMNKSWRCVAVMYKTSQVAENK